MEFSVKLIQLSQDVLLYIVYNVASLVSMKNKLQFYLEIVTCDPLNYTMDHFKFIASIQKEEFISALRVLLQQSLELHVYDETTNRVKCKIKLYWLEWICI